MNRIGFVLAGGLGKRMQSSLPKVLHQVRGRAMVARAIDAVKSGGVERMVAVLSHASDEVRSALPSDVEVVVQDRPRGTASAIVDAKHYLEDPNLAVLVSFGDMPWLNPVSVAKLVDAIEHGADSAVLSYQFDDPPHFGRIVRDNKGGFRDIVEYKDCTDEQKEQSELNAGMFAFRSGPLVNALSKLDDDNEAGELYLTDVPGHICASGGDVVTVSAESLQEALGVNDKKHLEFAESVPDIDDSEGRLDVADSVYNELVGRQ